MPTTIQDLHKLAYSRLPKADVHDTLHNMAVQMFGVESLKDCEPKHLYLIADQIKRFPVLQRPSRQSPVATRSRSGRPNKDGVVRMISPQQKHMINGLASEMRWSSTMLSKYLQRYFECDSIDSIGTMKKGSEVIKALLGIKADKRKRLATGDQRTG